MEWHEARKASKRLRYAAEAATPVLGAPAKRLVKQVKHVQELLGDHQDAVVARPVLREIGIAAHLDRENGFTYGLLHQQQTDAGRLTRRHYRRLARPAAQRAEARRVTRADRTRGTGGSVRPPVPRRPGATSGTGTRSGPGSGRRG